MPITRVGLVAKRGLDAAAGALAELAGWLEARQVHAVFETDTAALAGLPAGRRTVSRDELPRTCDLIVVLGGDGTLIGMADRIAEAGAEVAILGVNFGSLGFLTEITLPELYPSLESVLGGTAQIEERMMLRSRTLRDGVVHAEIDLAALHAKRLTLFGVSNKLRSKQQRAAAVPRFVAEVVPLIASGRIEPQIDRVVDFVRLPAAKARMEEGAHVGKIVLRAPAAS